MSRANGTPRFKRGSRVANPSFGAMRRSALLVLTVFLVALRTTALSNARKPRPPRVKTRKVRLDDLLVERGVVATPGEAMALVLAGNVFVKQDERVTSASQKLAADTPLRIKSRKSHPWVSRGGLKLAKAMDQWQLQESVQGCDALDIGCSTGGFTDVLLHHGARRVFAVDVGYNLLDWRLRTDPRVVVLERTNARGLNATTLRQSVGSGPGDVNIRVLVCDASFIRLATVLPAAMALCSPGAIMVALVKPQFEAERHEVESGGVVRDRAVHEAVCARAVEWVAESPGWTYVGLEPSPIKGPSGNVEFLLFARKDGDGSSPLGPCGSVE